MNVLIIGSGAREHALGWKIKQSPLLDTLFFLPGNPGTLELGINLPGTTEDFKAIGDVIISNRIGMVVVGPEMPLVNGIREELESDRRLRDVKIIGPGREGAKLEGSKDFAKQFMHRYHIPTAPYSSFTKETLSEGYRFLGTLKPPYVLKADGPAAGKGVIIVHSQDEAEKTLAEMTGGKFGKSSETVVVEKFLEGIELSVFILTDGENYVMLPEAKDYKRVGVNDTGMNTGGMGSVSPVPFANDDFMKKVKDRIVGPTLTGLKTEGIRYTGFIFFGLINCDGEPYVIEYNVRMGDPETEAVMPRVKSDFLALLDAASCGELHTHGLEVDHHPAATVMLVSGGYPGEFKKGFAVTGCGNVTESILFHAGTKMETGILTTGGGRVLAVTSTGSTISEALRKCYNSVGLINFENRYFRPDIGYDLTL